MKEECDSFYQVYVDFVGWVNSCTPGDLCGHARAEGGL